MGAIFIAGPGQDKAVESGELMLMAQGFGEPARLSVGQHTVLVYPRQGQTRADVLTFPNGDFIAASGSLVFRGHRGIDALDAIYDAFQGDFAFLQEAIGQFAVIVARAGTAHLSTDRMGGAFIFDADAVASTSFLAVAATAKKLTLNTHAVYEYVLTGGVTGDQTIVDEIRALPRRATLRLSQDARVVIKADQGMPEPDERPLALVLEDNLVALKSYMKGVGTAFEGKIACPITGGYDSRLMLALVRDGGWTPDVFLFGQSGVDFEVAMAVAAAEGLDLMAISAAPSELLPVDEFVGTVERHFLESDGWPAGGIFHNNVDHFGRASDYSDVVFLHGGGGEIYRNFFHLPAGRDFTATQVAKAMYARFDPQVCTQQFDFDHYIDQIAGKMRDLAQPSSAKIDRQVIEWLYLNFRGRAWFGRQNATDNMAYPALLPFYDSRTSDLASRIPTRLKQNGRFEAELIRRTRPGLAGIGSNYGHDFASPPPLKRRVSDAVKDHLPPGLRPAVYAARSRMRGRSVEEVEYLSSTYLQEVFPKGPHRMSSLFRWDRTRDAGQASRLLTVEYFAERLKADIGWAARS